MSECLSPANENSLLSFDDGVCVCMTDSSCGGTQRPPSEDEVAAAEAGLVVGHYVCRAVAAPAAATDARGCPLQTPVADTACSFVGPRCQYAVGDSSYLFARCEGASWKLQSAEEYSEECMNIP